VTAPGQADGQNQAGTGGVHVLLGLAPNLPPVPGTAPELQRLGMYLLSNAAAAASGHDGRVAVYTELQAGKIVLRVEDSGPSLTPEQLDRLFDPSCSGREGSDRLELAASKSLVRRLGGSIRGENRPGGGVAVVVELPAAVG